MDTRDKLKAMAHELHKKHGDRLSKSYERIAHNLGFKNWDTLSGICKQNPTRIERLLNEKAQQIFSN